MASSSRISLSDLNPPALTGPQRKRNPGVENLDVEEEVEAEDVLEVESIETSKVNEATEPAQAIINSLSVNPDLEKATKTRKRRSKKATKATSTTVSKKKTSSKTRSAASKKIKN